MPGTVPMYLILEKVQDKTNWAFGHRTLLMVLSPKIGLSEAKKKIHVQDYNVYRIL